MKFLMNGCLLLATADGATLEIIEEIGADNMVCMHTGLFSSICKIFPFCLSTCLFDLLFFANLIHNH